MRFLSIIIFVLSFQTKDKPTTKEIPQLDSLTQDISNETVDCIYYEKGKKQETTFPFNESNKIELVSYEYKSRLSIHDDELIKSGKFIVPKIHQRIILNKAQSDSIFSILVNIKSHVLVDSISAGKECYNPQHSIVFYKNEVAVAFFEICFSCSGMRKSKGIEFGIFCFEKYCILERFFIANKVDYGINVEQFDFECASILEPRSPSNED